MEPTTYDRLQNAPTTGGNSSPSRDLNAAADKAASAIHNATRKFANSAEETVDQAKQKAGELYNQVNRTGTGTFYAPEEPKRCLSCFSPWSAGVSAGPPARLVRPARSPGGGVCGVELRGVSRASAAPNCLQW